MKFNIQDRIVLDEMVDTFTTEMTKQHHEYDLDGKRPIITKQYWLQMIAEVQEKIDSFTTVKALKQSNNIDNMRTKSYAQHERYCRDM